MATKHTSFQSCESKWLPLASQSMGLGWTWKQFLIHTCGGLAPEKPSHRDTEQWPWKHRPGSPVAKTVCEKHLRELVHDPLMLGHVVSSVSRRNYSSHKTPLWNEREWWKGASIHLLSESQMSTNLPSDEHICRGEMWMWCRVALPVDNRILVGRDVHQCLSSTSKQNFQPPVFWASRSSVSVRNTPFKWACLSLEKLHRGKWCSHSYSLPFRPITIPGI